MIGKSWDGSVANGVAATGVEGLETIVPISAISSWYDYYRANGALYTADFGPAWLSGYVDGRPPEVCQPVRWRPSTSRSGGTRSPSAVCRARPAFSLPVSLGENGTLGLRPTGPGKIATIVDDPSLGENEAVSSPNTTLAGEERDHVRLRRHDPRLGRRGPPGLAEPPDPASPWALVHGEVAAERARHRAAGRPRLIRYAAS